MAAYNFSRMETFVIEPAHQIESFMLDLPAPAKAALGHLVKRRRLPQEMQVFAAEPNALLFLYSGQIGFYAEERQRVVELARHGPGTILGLRSVLENRPSEIQAVTREECEVGVIRADDFRQFLEEFPLGYMAIARLLGCELHSVYEMLRRSNNRIC
jgi:CRP-like cAMP-binding protein